MNKSSKLTVYLTDRNMLELTTYCRLTGIGKAEAIRRLLDRALEESLRDEYKRATIVENEEDVPIG